MSLFAGMRGAAAGQETGIDLQAKQEISGVGEVMALAGRPWKIPGD